MKQQIYSILLATLLSLAGNKAWAQTQISTAAELLAITDTTATYELTADIDMAGQNWTSLKGFAGTFDGKGHTIKNLGAPLFYSTEGDATIKNLTLKSDEPLVYTGGSNGFGVFICLSNETGEGTTLIENCVNKTAVDNQSGKNWTGGFIGGTNKGSKNSTTTIRNCQNLAAISSQKEAVAGFVGSHRLGMLVIENSTNSGNITAGTSAAGGFIGQAQGNNSAEASFGITDSHNLGIITATNDRAGGLVGACYGLDNATFNRCWNEGAVTAGTNRAAGIIGYLPNWTNKLTVSNCFNIAPITAEANAGAIVDLETKLWQASSIENCWNIGAVSGNGFSSTSNIARSNCYDLNGSDTGITQITAEELKSGSICYQLNKGNIETPAWHQKLGEGGDDHPILTGTDIVYLSVEQHCDGTPKGEASYSNSSSGQRDPHNYVGGICDYCGIVDVSYMTPVDGVYQIGTAAQLRWLSAAINKKAIDNNPDVVLTADIDLEGEEFSPIGIFGDTRNGINYDKVQFKGHFDGQGHIVYNLKITGTGNYEIGLFSRLGWGSGAWVKNLGVVNAEVSSTNTNGRVGAVVGIVGTSCVVENCFAYNVVITNESGQEVGGVVGSLSGTMNNCWTNYETAAYRYGTVNNCYSLENTPEIETEIASGQLCYKLNGSSFLDPIWFQTLSTDQYPVPDSTHAIVYPLTEGGYASVTEENFTDLSDAVVATERNFCQTIIADQAVIDLYAAELDKMEATTSLSDFFAAYRAGLEVKETVKTSEQAYLAYISVCENLRVQLAENATQNSYREAIENYLDKENFEEPGEDYPNGSFAYILETHTLTDTQIAAEAEYANTLMNRFLVSNPDPGTEMTLLLKNPAFADGWEGWETSGTGELGIGGQRDVMVVARGRNGSFTVQQSLSELPNGIYAARISSLSELADDRSLKYHTGEIFINGNHNFVMTPIEGMVPEDEADDGVNCHLSDPNPEVYTIENNAESGGYVPDTYVAASYAFSFGRYQNYVAVEVTDGNLTLGIRNRDYSYNTWQPFADVHLYYLGTVGQASEMLADVLQGYCDRANTILNIDTYEYSAAYDRNFSQELRSKLEKAVAESEEATDGAKQMELVNTFSSLFDELYDCRKAYKELAEAADYIDQMSTAMMQDGLITAVEFDDLQMKSLSAWAEFADGIYTADEARQKAKELRSIMSGPEKSEDGFFELATAEDLCWLSTYVNHIDRTAKARLTADIDMSSVQNFTPIGLFRDATVDGINVGADVHSFSGTLDGQGHIIRNLTINEQDYHETGLFSRMTDAATVKDLGIENATISGIRSNRVGILVGWMGVPTIQNVFAVGEIELNAAGNAVAQRILCPECWSPRKVQNCWTVTEAIYGSRYVSDNPVNCYSKVTAEEMASGELCYVINEGASENVFFQTLSTDAYPVPDASHLIVYKAEDGTYYNEADGIAAVRGDAKQTDAIYDLSGRRVGKATKGIYIINGRKVLK